MDTIRLGDKPRCRMIAHRGVSGIERENTAAAFIAAGNRSYYGIETDVHVTRDGQYVICHDPNLRRVSGVDLPIEESTLAELQAVPLLDVEGGTRTDIRVPTLADYISICHRYGKHAVLELKSDFTPTEIGEIVEIIRGFDHFEETTFISFIPDNLLRLRAAEPTAKAQLLPSKYEEWLLPFLIENRIDADIYHGALTQEMVDTLHKAGLEVNCWTVDTVEAAERVLAMGVDYITSNILE